MVGQKLTLNDESYNVVGVLPDTFYLPSTRQGSEQRKPDIWIPYDASRKGTEAERNRRRMQVFARLRSGVTLQQARDEMQTIARRLEEQNPTLEAGFSANVFPVYVEDLGQELRRNLIVLLSAVGHGLAAGVRQSREPDAHARDGATARTRHSQSAGRVACTTHSPDAGGMRLC